MIAINFGNSCFKVPASEQSILIVVAPKSEYSSLDEFVTSALIFLESDREFYDNWTDMYADRIYSPASDEEIQWMCSQLAQTNMKLHILHDPILKAVHIIPPKWNDMTLGVETETEYIFYLWGTSV